MHIYLKISLLWGYNAKKCKYNHAYYFSQKHNRSGGKQQTVGQPWYICISGSQCANTTYHCQSYEHVLFILSNSMPSSLYQLSKSLSKQVLQMPKMVWGGWPALPKVMCWWCQMEKHILASFKRSPGTQRYKDWRFSISLITYTKIISVSWWYFTVLSTLHLKK